MAFDRLLVYATAGGAGGELFSNFAIPGSASTSVTYGAWTAGGGLESAITDNLSARVEYLFFDTGDVRRAQSAPPFLTVITGRL